MLLRLCRLTELREGAPTSVTSGKYAFTVVKDGDKIYVIQAVCPHGRWLFAVGTYSNGVLVCRGHNMVVNLEKGVGDLRGATYRIRIYRPIVKDGELYVEV